MGYFDQLYNASYNGVPFYVEDVEGKYGRRVAVHTYPFRDGGWVEDLGKKMPNIQIRAFLEGDDVIAQRDWLLTVCSQPGPGILIHPTRGIMTVNLIDFTVSESKDHGRQIIIDFHFLAGGNKLFPSIVTSTLDAILSAVGITNSAAAADFIAQAAAPIANGAQVISAGAETAGIFAAAGGAVVKSATNVFSLATSLSGSFGRYAGGSTGSGTGSITGSISSIGGITSQIAALAGLAATARTSTAAAAANVNSTAAGI